MTVMIGVDPHKGSHTAVAADEREAKLDEVRVRSGPRQLERLLQWAQRFPERTWAIENATGLGYLLAQQLVAAGERVIDVQPKLAARVRLLATESINKNDAHDAYSVAIAALRAKTPRMVRAEDHAAVMKLWSKRHRDLARHRNRIACRLHSLLCELVAGGVPTRSAPKKLSVCSPTSTLPARSRLPGSSSPRSCSTTFAASTCRSYDRKIAQGKTPKEALRALKRRVSDALYARMGADARRAARQATAGPGGQPGNDSVASAAGSHPETPALRPSHSRTRKQATTNRSSSRRVASRFGAASTRRTA